MDSALSEEEFHRLQLQLIELRTSNYQLTDQCKKQETELTSLNQQVASLDKDLQRASKAVSKSKKAKEFDLLIQENESLQRKLHNQEEEFRLQNSTLMQELTLLISKNEELESALSRLDASNTEALPLAPPSTNDSSGLSEEVMRLKAENSALQANIGDIKQKFDSELKLLRSVVEGVDITESDPSSNDAADVSLTSLIQESELLSHYNDIKLSLDTEKAENGLLHERINELKKTSSAEAADQLREKLKKKQESYITLQNEKESLYAETNQKITFLEEARQRDIKNFHSQIEKLNNDLKTARQETVNMETLCEQRVKDFEITITNLKSKVNENSAKNLELAQQEVARLQEEVATLTSTLSDTQRQLEETTSQLSDKEKAVSSQAICIDELQMQLADTQQNLVEKSQAAEKRKKLLDELAIKSQEDSDSYKSKLSHFELSRKQEMDDLKSVHKSETSKLAQLLDVERVKVSQFGKLSSDLELLGDQCKSLEEAKGWLQRSLQEAEAKLKEEGENYKTQIANLENSHDQTISDMNSQHELSMQTVNQQLEQKSNELEEANSEKEALHQKVADNVQVMKLHEKKGASLMKDLKRQLAQERKRADRSEQRIQELSSTDSKLRQPSAEPFFLPIDPERLSARGDDTSSVSSWSGANYNSLLNNSATARETSVASIRETSTPCSSPLQSSEHDMPSLLILIESLQKEKTLLSERVSILEQGNSAMAEDLLKKQSIIEYYTMEGKEYVSTPKRVEKMTLKRVVDFVKDKGDEGMNEKYRKCQRMLEETLTKNMCLQNDLEQLSKQLASAKISSGKS